MKKQSNNEEGRMTAALEVLLHGPRLTNCYALGREGGVPAVRAYLCDEAHQRRVMRCLGDYCGVPAIENVHPGAVMTAYFMATFPVDFQAELCLAARAFLVAFETHLLTGNNGGRVRASFEDFYARQQEYTEVTRQRRAAEMEEALARLLPLNDTEAETSRLAHAYAALMGPEATDALFMRLMRVFGH
jgi:hypothetical protein